MRAILDANLVLRDIDDDAETATAAETAVALPMATNHYLNAVGDYMNDDYHFKAVLYGIVATGSPTSVVFSVEVSASADGGSSKVVRSYTMDANDRVELVMSMHEIRKLLSTAAYIFVKATITGGSTPTLVYGAYLTKV